MKFKLLRDLLVYIALPFLIFNTPSINNTQLALSIICFILIIYCIYTNAKENRMNFTLLLLSVIIISYIIIAKSFDELYRYFGNTCILLLLGLLISILRIFDKDIIIRAMKDILRMLEKNTTVIVKLLRKKSMMIEVKQAGSILEANFILIAFLRIINVLIYNVKSNSYFNFIINFIGCVFGIVAIYKIVKIFRELDKITDIKNNKKTNNKKGKIIHFNTFK